MKQTTLFEDSRYAVIPKIYSPETGYMVMPCVHEFKKFYTYIVVAGDTIDGLARRFYGDSTYQWVLITANDLIFPAQLVMGQKLLVPDRDEVFRFMNK
jgi:nucleoid-associated protein YgaU